VSSEIGHSFGQDVIERFDRDVEVRIETHSASGERHRTVIWSIVDSGEVFIRSYHGPEARWYREALGGGETAIWLGERRVDVRLSEATSGGDISRCSRGFESKYPDDPATPAMLRDEVLQTTLRVEPA
jgi:hypothetical protein